jgi:hypothetical protein
VIGQIEDVNNPNKLAKELKLNAIKGKADLPDDYTIRTYYNQSTTFANQLIKIAFPNKFSASYDENELFTINYSCLNDGLVEYYNTSESLDSINFKYIEAKEFINESESGFNHSFTETFKNKIQENDHKALIEYQKLGPAALLAIPTPDHYFPLLYTLGLKDKEDSIQFFNDKYVAGSLSMTSVRIG